MASDRREDWLLEVSPLHRRSAAEWWLMHPDAEPAVHTAEFGRKQP